MSTQQAVNESPVVLNGVSVTGLFDTIKAVKADNELAKFQFRAMNKWIDGGHNRSTIQAFYGCRAEDESRAEPFVVLGVRQMNPDGINSGLDIRPNPLQHLLARLDRPSIAADHKNQSRIGTRVGGRFDLIGHLQDWHWRTNGVDAILAKHTIFKSDSSDAGALESAHGPRGLQGPAIAGLAINQHRDIQDFCNRARSVRHLGHSYHAAVGKHEAPMHPVAGKVEKLVTAVLDQAREHWVRRARRHDSSRCMQNLSEAETLVVIVHFVIPLLRDYRRQLLAGETFCQRIRVRRPNGV